MPQIQDVQGAPSGKVTFFQLCTKSQTKAVETDHWSLTLVNEAIQPLKGLRSYPPAVQHNAPPSKT